MSSLKTFIRNVRATKTIADERAVVQKESAAIRASFREESHDPNTRRNNVAKLLYLFTLGERTHFGQIECLKLLASPRFSDKRLGYLGTMLLLDENQEVLTLVTNSLKNDLNNSNQYVVSLALCTLGNIASAEMSRDVSEEIQTILSSSNPYIRRKAALCAMKICRKVPDLQELFLDKAKQLLSDRNHGVLICGLALVISMCEADEEEGGEQGMLDHFKTFVPALVKLLKALSSSGYSPEHDVTNITDPFLQVKILQLLRVLGRSDAEVSEQINDILAQVATNTDSTKNVGNAILYEAVLTILDIEADSGLRVLGVNILGKFLTNKDNNIRYVALNTLIKVVSVEPNAVQRHRNTILDCLRDPDISIRRRALDLSFTLINDSNVKVLIRELLSFLEVADAEFKPIMTTQIGIAADRYAPNKQWHIEVILRVLKLAGNYVKEQILSSFVRLIAISPELQTYSVQKLYAALKRDVSQEALNLTGAWCIGEFGDALLRGGQFEDDGVLQVVMESDVVDLFSTILHSSHAGQTVTEYVVTAAMKLTTRLTEAGQVERLRRLLQSYESDLDVEIQQRAIEYGGLFGYNDMRRGVLERMPPPEIREDQRVLGEATPKKKRVAKTAIKKKPAQVTEQDMLLDLMGDNDIPGAPTSGETSGNQRSADLLADILGSEPTGSTRTRSTPAAGNNISNIMDIFGGSTASGSIGSDVGGMTTQAQASAATHQVYNKDELYITFQVQRSSAGVQISARFKNTSMMDKFGNVSLQAAVPKSLKLQLQAISTTSIDGGQEATQQMRITSAQGPPPAKVRLRLKLAYTKDGGTPVQEQFDWSEPT